MQILVPRQGRHSRVDLESDSPGSDSTGRSTNEVHMVAESPTEQGLGVARGAVDADRDPVNPFSCLVEEGIRDHRSVCHDRGDKALCLRLVEEFGEVWTEGRLTPGEGDLLCPCCPQDPGDSQGIVKRKCPTDLRESGEAKAAAVVAPGPHMPVDADGSPSRSPA